MRLAIEPLDASHDRQPFACGIEPLDRYLTTQASQDVRKRVAACFALTEGASRRVLGYYTLSATTILLDELPVSLAKKVPRYPLLPATLLGRLAIDLVARGRGFGELLLLDALHRSLDAADQIGAMAVVVSAKDASAAAFYSRYGFVAVPEHAHRLFLPMAQIARLF